jgi:hypothetical protein
MTVRKYISSMCPLHIIEVSFGITL